jgi:hypothetical protein
MPCFLATTQMACSSTLCFAAISLHRSPAWRSWRIALLRLSISALWVIPAFFRASAIRLTATSRKLASSLSVASGWHAFISLTSDLSTLSLRSLKLMPSSAAIL